MTRALAHFFFFLGKAFHTFFGFSAVCRFRPTCSEYFRESVETHGIGAGTWLGLRRLAKCHPWGASGFDPVRRI